MLSVDLTVPIVILGVAVGIVLALRAAVAWAERRTDERTDRLLRELGIGEAPAEVKEDAPASGGDGGEPRAKA